VQKFNDVLIANDAYIIGYPTSIGKKNYPQIDYKRPLVRKGVIAGKNPEKIVLSWIVRSIMAIVVALYWNSNN